MLFGLKLQRAMGQNRFTSTFLFQDGGIGNPNSSNIPSTSGKDYRGVNKLMAKWPTIVSSQIKKKNPVAG